MWPPLPLHPLRWGLYLSRSGPQPEQQVSSVCRRMLHHTQKQTTRAESKVVCSVYLFQRRFQVYLGWWAAVRCACYIFFKFFSDFYQLCAARVERCLPVCDTGSLVGFRNWQKSSSNWNREGSFFSQLSDTNFRSEIHQTPSIRKWLGSRISSLLR